MLSAFSRKISLPAAIALVFLAGVLAGYWRYRQTRAELLDELTVNARRCAMAFEHRELAQLAGSPDDIGKPTFTHVRERLIRFRRVGVDVRTVYLVRQTSGVSGVKVLAASDRTLVPGRVDVRSMVQAGTLSVLIRVISSGEAEAIESNDPTGHWAAGYAQVAGSVAGSSKEVLGLEVDTDHWARTLWMGAMGTAGYVWLFLILPLATLVSTRRQNRQRAKVRDLTEAMEQAQSAVMIVTPKQRIEYANAGFCRQLGYSREELIGREWREFQAFDAPPEVVKDLTTTVGAGEPWRGEWMMKRKDGMFYPV
ncbi:MAG: PAS domain-containing protein, partial [Opitutus sp.]